MQEIPLDALGQDIDLLRVVRGRLDDLKVIENTLVEKIKLALGEAEAGLVEGHRVVTWKTVTSRRVDTKALREAHPDVADAHTVETVSRRFVLMQVDDD